MDDFRKQVVEQYDILLRFAQKFTYGDRALAQDLVQDTTIRAFERQHQFTPGTRLDSWLYRILQNLFLDHRRSLKVRDSIEFSDVEEGMLELSLEPEQEAITYYGQVCQKIQLLGSEQRDVLLCVGVKGFSYIETAAMLGIPVGTVMSRLSRARANIATMCGETQKPSVRRTPSPRSRATHTSSIRPFLGRRPVLLFSKPALYLPSVRGAEVQVFSLV